jgi:hypothetical protein
VHFFVEADRFCRFLKAKLASDWSITTEVGPALARDAALMAAALRESQTET